MLRNYLKIAWRNLMKNKTFSFINIFGLAIGMTCCMLISLYLYHELSYDQHHKNGDRLYQLGTVFIKQGQEDRSANTPGPMAATMQQEFPEIEKTARMMKMFADDKTLLQYTPGKGDTRSFYETRGYMADSTFFQLFTYSFKEGNPSTALMEPKSIVLSEAIGQKMFGNEPALNKIIRISSSTNGDHDYRVTGVYEAGLSPSHIDARFFMSFQGGDIYNYVRNLRGLVNNNMFYTYFLLKPGTDPSQLESKFPAFIQKHAAADLKAMGMDKRQFLIPLKNIHLHANVSTNVSASGSVTYLYILGSIALFTLMIACINFMNLSTARSSKRSAEVGVRKVLGAERSSLMRQFLGESVLMAFIAFIWAALFTRLLLPVFEDVSGKEFAITTSEFIVLAVAFFALALLTGLLAGSYPAFYLSSFKPVRVLKGKFQNSFAAVSLRKALVIIQFVISVVLIIASVVIARQMNFLRSKDLGFARDQQLIIPLRSNTAKEVYPAMKAELQKNPGILSVGASAYYPGIFNPRDMPLYKEGKTMNEARRTFMNTVDNSYLQTLGIEPVAGRLFSSQFPGDTNFRIILNERSVREMGFASPQEAVGKNVGIDFQGQTYRLEVVGVVKDFHFKDLHEDIEPYGFQLNDENFNYLIAHTREGQVGHVLQAVQKTWNQLNPNEPFEYSFLDEDFARNYVAEERLSAIVKYFTLIAIFISCLGLFGLATFSAEQRTKEIGIRKVLGASSTQIVGLLSRDFLLLVLVAIILASPIAWYVMDKWLQDFAYRTTLGWSMFLVSAGVALAIAFGTISLQAIRAAHANPVKNLRTE